MKKFVMLLGLLCGMGLWSENILLNGNFAGKAGDYPDHWVIKNSGFVQIVPQGAPDKKHNSVKFSGGSGILRQYALKLVPGEKYRLSFWFKSRNLTKRGYAIIANIGWQNSAGCHKLPANTAYQKITKEFTAPGSRAPYYSMVLSFDVPDGEVEIADCQLIALTPQGKQNSYSYYAQGNRQIIPLTNLRQLTKPELPVLLPATKSTQCRYSIAGKTATITSQGRTTLKLGKLKPGKYNLKLEAVNQGQVIESRTYQIELLPEVPRPYTTPKRLNNLTVELLNQEMAAGETAKFVNEQENWIYVSAPLNTKLGKIAHPACSFFAQMFSCGKEKITPLRPTVHPEQSFLLPRGVYSLTVPQKGRLIVRSIPETMVYPLAISNLPHYVPTDWEFVRTHAIPEVAVFSQFPRNWNFDNFKGLDTTIIANHTSRKIRFNTDKLTTQEARDYLLSNRGNTNPKLGGISLDEFGWSDMKEFRLLREVYANYPLNRRVYTWIADVVPGNSRGLSDTISGLTNLAPCGRGRIMFEAYCEPAPTEERAWHELEKIALTGSMRRLHDAYPEAHRAVGFILCPSNLTGLDNQMGLPEIDEKYFLDMQFYIIANHPEFRDLGQLGYWGASYADEEMLRWSLKLFRHYVLEGKREMLSKEYGFKFKPGLLHNGDFERGFQHWQTAGAVTVDNLKHYGRNIQRRRNTRQTGDNFAALKKLPNQVSSVTQTAKNLIPGKFYMLSWVSADQNDVQKKIFRQVPPGIAVQLTGAKIIPELSFNYPARFPWRKKAVGLTYERVVFQATAPTVKVQLTNAPAPVGSTIYLNYVKLAPYYRSK